MNYRYTSAYTLVAMTFFAAHGENDSSLTSFVAKNALLGALAGGLEVTVNQPLVTIKNSLQQRLPIALNGSMYKGYLINASSMGPITAFQVTAHALIKKQCDLNGVSLSESRKLAAGFAAGAFSGVVSGPTELVMLKQKNLNTTLRQAFSHVVRQKGIAQLWRGFVPTALRDGGFSMGYLALDDLFKKPVKKIVDNDYAAALLAGAASGLVVAIPTHPLDTIKTLMQAGDITLMRAINQKYQVHGLKGFYDGLSPRAFRIMLAIPLMSMVRHELSPLLDL